MNRHIGIKTCLLTAFFIISLLVLGEQNAICTELKLESVSPTAGELGKNLQVTFKGTGFDDSTRVSMYPDTGNKRRIIGSVDTPGYAYEVTLIGGTAYVADRDSGLQVIDVSTPSQPVIIGSADTPGYARGVTVIGGTAYVACGGYEQWSGLQVIDVSTPSQPVIIGSVETGDDACGVTVIGGTAYVADGYSGLQVIDVSNPYSPFIIGSVHFPGNANGVTVTGDTAYVAADGYIGLQVIDVSTPSQPVIVGSADIPNAPAHRVTVTGDTAYVAADDWGGLEVIDVSNPDSPVIIGFVDTPGSAYGVTVTDDTAYVADGGGLQIIDVSTPSLPFIIGTVYTPGYAYGVTVADGTAYVADGDSGLQIIDVSTPSLPVIIGSADTPGFAWEVAVNGSTAYVADGDIRLLQVIDISTPSQPFIIGTVYTPGNALGVSVTGGTAYVADYSGGLQIIDVSTPSLPVIGSADTIGSAMGVTVIGDTAYVADYYGLQIIDVSTPSQPVIIGSAETSGEAWGVTVTGDTAYMYGGADFMCRDGGLQVIDVSTPSQPVIIASAETPGSAEGVTVIGGTAYVADGNSGLQVIDVSTPSQPVIIGSADTPGSAHGVTVTGDTAYVADGLSGLQVIDVSTPSQPKIIGSVYITGYANGVTVAGDTVYIEAGSAGLITIPLKAITEISPVTVNSDTEITVTLPSPPAPGHWTLRVFNDKEYDELPGAVTFFESEDYEKEMRKKALIVAGRLSAGDGLWDSTRMCTNHAYLALERQGYDKDRIYYLSMDMRADPDGDGIPDADGTSSLENLEYVFTEWASQDTDELLIYMTAHGKRGGFYLSENETLEAEQLDTWLDSLQESTSVRVVFIYDACYSGSFIEPLTPPDGKERIVITSSSPDQFAYFTNEGRLSFSYQFWASVFFNANLYDAFASGRDAIGSQQIPHLDGDGDGIGYEEDRKTVPKSDMRAAKNILIGKGYIAAAEMPAIGLVSEAQTLNGETSETLEARDITAPDKILRVWAVITPPNHRYGPGDPVTDLPEITLEDSDGDGVYKGEWKGFYREGAYQIAVYAACRGASGTGMMYSKASETSVIQTEASPAPLCDLDGDGEAGLKDMIAGLRVLSGEYAIWYDYPTADIDVNGDNRIGMAEVFYLLRETAK